MVFSSTIFLCYFLPLFLITYWSVPKRFKNYTALLWSLVFYTWGAPKFVLILLVSILIDFLLVQQIHQAKDTEKKPFLLLSMLLNVGLLFFFKYSNFFIENINSILETFGINGVHWTKLALPIGISFFTFQKISYVVDVYKGKSEPLKNISDLCLYILLFPQLIAGPIVRFGEIKAQLLARKTTIDSQLNGLFRFSIGLGKKMLIANQMGSLADHLFTIPPEALTTGQAWLAALAYAFQIYFDFSGYSDMAIGLGLMMGFRFPENFNAPYISKNITEFWKRWHITLGHWMRDYLYIPLGGNRVKSKARLYFNLSFVFLISGFWHGAAWTFIAWGAFHGLFLILDRIFLLDFLKKMGTPISVLLTFIITLVGWVLFRSDTITDASNHILTMFDWRHINWTLSTQEGIKPYYLEYRYWFILVLASLLSFLPLLRTIEKKMNAILATKPNIKLTLFKTVVAFVLLFVCITEVITTGDNPFIYYRF